VTTKRILPTDRTMTHRVLIVALTLTLALLLVACGSDSLATDGDGATVLRESVQASDSSQSDDPDSVAGEQSALAAEDAVVEDVAAADETPLVPATFDPGAPLLTDQLTLLPEGSHRVDSLGTPFSFVAPESMFVQFNFTGFVVLTHAASRGPDDRDIVMMRVSALSDPASPTEPWTTIDAGWAADDFDGWLDNLAPGVTISNRTDATLGGLDAVRFDAELGDITCGTGYDCVNFAHNYLGPQKGLNPGSFYRIWIVDQGVESPLVVVVGINGEAQRDWFDAADQVLSTVAFGEVSPNPAELIEAGQADLTVLGGVSVKPQQRFVLHNESPGFYGGRYGLEPVVASYMQEPQDQDGVLIESVDEFITYIEAQGGEVAELEPLAVDGLEARVFDLSVQQYQPMPVLTFGPADELGWQLSEEARIWLMEHPERGLLAVTAHRYGPAAEAYPALLGEVEQMLGSLRFSEVN